jgi:protein AFG1
LSDVPVMDVRQRNEARRFVVLIDALYEARVRLVLAAHAPLHELVAPLLDASGRGAVAEAAEVEVGTDEASVSREQPQEQPSFSEAPVAGSYRVDGELAAFFTAKDEAFMLRRTLSRLTEMTG